MNYERIFSGIEYDVEQLKLTFGCKSWRSTCLANDVVRKFIELREELKSKKDWKLDRIINKIDAILGDKE